MIQIIDYRSMIDLIYNEGSDGKYHLFNSVVRSISKTYGDLFEQKEKISFKLELDTLEHMMFM